jgi:hypothetical protein
MTNRDSAMSKLQARYEVEQLHGCRRYNECLTQRLPPTRTFILWQGQRQHAILQVDSSWVLARGLAFHTELDHNCHETCIDSGAEKRYNANAKAT